jgi:hypothetical protein
MKTIASFLIVAAFALLGVLFLSGCSSLGSLGVTLETQYGSFRYELPEPKGTKK